MLSGALQIVLLVVIVVSLTVSSTSAAVSASPVTICHSRNISATEPSEVDGLVEMLQQPRCTHVIGDIVIANLSNIQLPVDIFKRVRKIYGSIIVVNNTDILSPIHFPSLRTVNASLLPAIVAYNNRNVMVSVGPHFKKALTQQKGGIMFAVIANRNFVIDADQYNLWWLAGYPNARILTDSGLMATPCAENFFKPIAFILGWLFVALTVAFSTVAFYDRKKQAAN